MFIELEMWDSKMILINVECIREVAKITEEIGMCSVVINYMVPGPPLAWKIKTPYEEIKKLLIPPGQNSARLI